MNVALVFITVFALALLALMVLWTLSMAVGAGMVVAFVITAAIVGGIAAFIEYLTTERDTD